MTTPGAKAPLARHPCLQQCRWRGTDVAFGDERLFRCQACGSEWVRSEPWAPVDCDGTRDAALEAELDRPPRQ